MSSLNSLRLFIDVQNKRLISSPFDPSTPALPTLIKDDVMDIEVYPLINNSFSGLGSNPYDPVVSTTLWTSSLVNVGPFTAGAESTYLAADAALTAEQKLFSVDVLAGGSNYAVGDILKVTNGTQVEAAKVEVTAVESGAVAAVRIFDEGAHTSGVVQPSTGRPTTIFVTGNGSASGCTLIAQFAQTFVGKLDLTASAIETNVISGTTFEGTTNIEVRIKNSGSGAALRYNTILQHEVSIKENIMDAE